VEIATMSGSRSTMDGAMKSQRSGRSATLISARAADRREDPFVGRALAGGDVTDDERSEIVARRFARDVFERRRVA